VDFVWVFDKFFGRFFFLNRGVPKNQVRKLLPQYGYLFFVFIFDNFVWVLDNIFGGFSFG
jgi:hypothetical protein